MDVKVSEWLGLVGLGLGGRAFLFFFSFSRSWTPRNHTRMTAPAPPPNSMEEAVEPAQVQDGGSGLSGPFVFTAATNLDDPPAASRAFELYERTGFCRTIFFKRRCRKPGRTRLQATFRHLQAMQEMLQVCSRAR